jgi:NTP pyrophosphatase (non-canonical NTP hydrolase)
MSNPEFGFKKEPTLPDPDKNTQEDETRPETMSRELAKECGEAIEGVEQLTREINEIKNPEEDPEANKQELAKLMGKATKIIYGVAALGAIAAGLAITHPEKYQQLETTAQNFLGQHGALTFGAAVAVFGFFMRDYIVDELVELKDYLKTKIG